MKHFLLTIFTSTTLSAYNVRIGDTPNEHEITYVAERKKIVHRACEKLLGRAIDAEYVPTIALVCSGGGYRALVSTMGSLLGAQDIGLLDCVTYIAALSGSTWMILPWMLGGLSLDEYAEELPWLLSESLTALTGHEADLIMSMLKQKYVHNQPITLVDFYGALLGNRLLQSWGDRRQRMTLFDLAYVLHSRKHPFPLCAAINADASAGSDLWYEITPFEIRSLDMKVGVAACVFGSFFDHGLLVQQAPELPLAYHLGTCGSAFAAHIDQLLEACKHRSVLTKIRDYCYGKIANFTHNKHLFTAAKVPNVARGLARTSSSDKQYLELMDAGCAPGFNLPYPLVAERNVDLIIFLDYSSDALENTQLHQAELYACEKGFSFPAIPACLPLNSCHVWHGMAHEPTVVYMPLVRDDALFYTCCYERMHQDLLPIILGFDVMDAIKHGYCKTTNLCYTCEQVAQLSMLTRFYMQANKKAIVDAIALKVHNK